jgi:hypothetical protein
MTDPLDEVHAARERRQRRYAIEFDAKGKPKLPELPEHDDLVGWCDFLTAVLHLDAVHPVTSGRHIGLVGGQGHIVLDRLGAPELEFRPASRIAKGDTLGADLVWQLLPGDGAPYQWSNHQATRIARVVRWLCDASGAITSRQETAQILTTYIEAAEEVQGNTYGTPGERYEAACALRPELDNYGRVKARRFLADATKPEIAIRVSDLARVAREALGSSVPHGWLDGHMDGFGWERVELQGQSLDGRDGRVRGLHASCDVYRGPISSVYHDEEP